MARVFIKPRKARPFWFGHPWVFSGAIERVRGKKKDGDIVDVFDYEGNLIGQGFWNEQSQIQVRLAALAHEGPLGLDLLIRRLDRAIHLRQDVLALPGITNAYRLVHGEGDGIPGLVADRIGEWIVVQVSALGLLPFLDPLLDRLQEALNPAGIVERLAGPAAEEEGLVREEAVLRGTSPEGIVEVVEGGIHYRCDPRVGQKTGFYSDQRDNRSRLAPLARDRDVLDAFSYVGGFGLAMARAGARSVRCVDSSEPALELLKLGIEANGVSERVVADQGNVLRVLDHDRKDGRSYDLVVLDPPRFVPKRSALERGLALYYEVNLKALNVLRDGGILITNSCSQHVEEHHLDEVLGSAAKEQGVRLQEIHRGGQAADHPVLMPLQESRYLKCRAVRMWR
jgi:23S rRNA (cytosine1962-C5)-methyltransferase